MALWGFTEPDRGNNKQCSSQNVHAHITDIPKVSMVLGFLFDLLQIVRAPRGAPIEPTEAAQSLNDSICTLWTLLTSSFSRTHSSTVDGLVAERMRHSD